MRLMGSTGPAVRGRPLRVLRRLSLLGASVALLWPGVWLGTSFDASVYVLAGARLRAGVMPYRDLWDSKPPGSLLVNALGQTALPWVEPRVVEWLITVVFTGATILLLDDLLRRRFSPVVSWVGSLVGCVAMACFPVALGGGLTETLAVLPLVAALWVIAVRSRTMRSTIVVGALLSCSCLFSLQCAPAVVCLGAAAVWRTGEIRSTARQAAALVAGALPAPGAVAAWLVVGGAFGDAVDQIVIFNFADREAGGQLASLLPVTILLLCGLAVPFAVAAAGYVRHPRLFDRVEWACLAWCLLYAMYILYQGRIFLHFVIPLVPPLIVLASRGLDELIFRIRSARPRLRWVAICLSMAGAAGMTISAVSTVYLSDSSHSSG